MDYNKDKTIHFNVEDWHCTDPDQYQYFRKVNDTTFEYIQLKDGYFSKLADDKNLTERNLLEVLNNNTMDCDWYNGEIDVTDYTEEKIKDYLSPYGGILDGVTDEVERNQLIAECIFETDGIFSDFDY